MPSRPPGRSTLISSPAVASWSGANIAPNVDVTTSKLPSGNGSLCASATSVRSGSPSAAARCRACSSNAGT